MSILEAETFTEDNFATLTSQIPAYLTSQDTKAQLYKSNVIQKLIQLASSTTSPTLQVSVLTQIDAFLTDSADLILVSQSSVLYLTTILLRSPSPDVQVASLTLLSSLCQYDENATSLLNDHNLIKNAVWLAEDILAKQPLSQPLVQHFSAFLFVCCAVSQKAQKKLSRAGISDFLCEISPKLSTEPLAAVFALLQLICQEKSTANAVIQRNFDQFLLKQLQSFTDGNSTPEIAQLALNLIGTICAVSPANSSLFLQNKTPTIIYQIILSTTSIPLLRFSISALVEILYADKGFKYANLTNNLRQIGQIDQLLQDLVDFPEKFAGDSECWSVWAILIRMIGSVPRKEDFVRQSVLCRGVLKRILEGLTSDLGLNCKISLLDALGQMFCRQELPAQVYLDDLAKTTSVVLKLKREFVSFKNQKSAEKMLYLEAVERCKVVLERLGHQEGRNSAKYTMYGMFIMGCALLIGAGVSFAIRGVN